MTSSPIPTGTLWNKPKYLELYQNLLAADSLRSLGCVSEFHFDGSPAGRKVHHSTIGTLCSIRTSVQVMKWQFLIPSLRLMDERRKIRPALAFVLQETNFPQNLTDLTISLEDSEPKTRSSGPRSFHEIWR